MAGRNPAGFQDEGLRYRDIAVITPDVEPYEPYLRASLTDLDIPFFIDRPRPLSAPSSWWY